MVVSSLPTIATINVNSLSEYAMNPTSRARRLRVRYNLECLGKSNNHICIQETKLNSKESRALRFSFPGWGVLYSNAPADARKAGVITLTSPAVMTDFTPTEVALPGCCEGHVLVTSYVSKVSRLRPYALINLYNPQGAVEQAAIFLSPV